MAHEYSSYAILEANPLTPVPYVYLLPYLYWSYGRSGI
jgi:hypothetical protein